MQHPKVGIVDYDYNVYGLLDDLPDLCIDWGVNEHREMSILNDDSASTHLSVEARTRIRLLFHRGINAAYGEIFHAAFRFTRVMQPALGNIQLADAIRISIHSRHLWDDGDDIRQELDCARQVLRDIRRDRRSYQACIVVVLSDRNATRVLLSEAIHHELNCNVVLAPAVEGTSFSPEHGPYAGAGAIQDLALSTIAPHAAVITHGSSFSELVVEQSAHRASIERLDFSFPRICRITWKGMSAKMRAKPVKNSTNISTSLPTTAKSPSPASALSNHATSSNSSKLQPLPTFKVCAVVFFLVLFLAHTSIRRM